jgi:hypothetical protein
MGDVKKIQVQIDHSLKVASSTRYSTQHQRLPGSHVLQSRLWEMISQ